MEYLKRDDEMNMAVDRAVKIFMNARFRTHTEIKYREVSSAFSNTCDFIP